MTRHNKKGGRARSKKNAEALFKQADTISQNEATTKKSPKKTVLSDQEIKNLQQKMYADMRRKATPKAIKNTISDAVDEDVGAQRPAGRTVNLESILQILEELSKVEDPEEIMEWFQGHGSTDPINHIVRLRNIFTNLTKSLNISRPNDAKTELQYILRTKDMKLMFLAPIEIFQCDKLIQKKTVAFVRGKGRYHPLMYSCSGWEACTKSHEKMLDARTWTENVVDFCTMYGCELRIGWERGKNLEDVGEIASHAEIKLMLWYAMRFLGKTTLKIPRLEDLMTLQKLRPHPRAEIIISEAPCNDCGIFQDRIQELTGIKFAFYVRDNVGKLKKIKTQSNYFAYPIDSSDTENESDRELRRKYLPKKKPRKSSPKAAETGNVATWDELALTSPMSTPKKHNKNKNEATLHLDSDEPAKVAGQIKKRKRKQKHLDLDDSDDMDYTPKTTTTPVTPTSMPRKRRSQKSSEIIDVHNKAQVILPSRKLLEFEGSPTAAKKGRLDLKYFYFEQKSAV